MDLKQRLSRWYTLYELNTSVYLLDFPSKVAVNLVLLTILSLITYSSCVYLPPYIYTMLTFFRIVESRTVASSTPEFMST